MQLIKTILVFFILSTFSCRENKLEPPLDKIFLCAMDEMINDINFEKEWLSGGTNYFSWVPDGYMQYDSVYIGNGNVAWSKFEDVDIDVEALINVLNEKFPEGHKLVQIPKEENEKKLRFEKKEKFCSWFFGLVKSHDSYYFLEGGFAISSRVGSGGHFVIEIDSNNICNVIAYEFAIF